MTFNFANDANGLPQAAATPSYDPATLQTMLQALPAIQQAQRRAQQLQAVNQGFTDQANQPNAAAGTMMHAQQGGLYPTVAKWQPNYAALGQQAVGALGQLATQPQANAAQAQLDIARNKQILPWLQATGQAPGGTANPAQVGVAGPPNSGFGSGNLYGSGWPGQGGGFTGQ